MADLQKTLVDAVAEARKLKPKLAQLEGIYKLKLSGTSSGTFLVDFKNNRVTPGDGPAPATIILPAAQLLGLMRGTADRAALAKGKQLRWEGSREAFKRLTAIFEK